jgi:hypothetical protein
MAADAHHSDEIREIRRRYNRQLWSGGIIILILLIILDVMLHLGTVGTAELIVSTFIGLAAAAVAGWMVVVSHRDASLARGRHPYTTVSRSRWPELPPWERVLAVAAGACAIIAVVVLIRVPTVATILPNQIFEFFNSTMKAFGSSNFLPRLRL